MTAASLSIDQIVACLKNHRHRLMAQVGALNAAIAALEGDTALDPTDPRIAEAPNVAGVASAVAGAPDAGKKPLRRYSDEEKARAVRLLNQSGFAAVAAEMGIAHRSIVDRWRREGWGADKAGHGHAPVVQLAPAKRPNPIDRSPHAGKGGYVPSGVKAPIDEAAARRAAFEDLDPGVFE